MKADETLEAFRKNKSGGGSRLDIHWNSRCAAIYGGYQKPLTWKEKGQLGQLSKYLLGNTRDVIDWSLDNWDKFVYKVALEAGLHTYPDNPCISGGVGFLLKYHAVALNMMQSASLKPTKPATIEPSAFPSDGSDISTMLGKESEPAATLEEVNTILFKYK